MKPIRVEWRETKSGLLFLEACVQTENIPTKVSINSQDLVKWLLGTHIVVESLAHHAVARFYSLNFFTKFNPTTQCQIQNMVLYVMYELRNRIVTFNAIKCMILNTDGKGLKRVSCSLRFAYKLKISQLRWDWNQRILGCYDAIDWINWVSLLLYIFKT